MLFVLYGSLCGGPLFFSVVFLQRLKLANDLYTF